MNAAVEAPASRGGDGHDPAVAAGFRDRLGPDRYYDYPAIKSPGWSWQIPAYFFTGGVAAGSYVVATLADLFGNEEDRAVSRAGRLVAFLFILVSPVMLIVDLGRPERFHHMMRIFKSRSPMNLGTWGLTGFGAFAALGLVRQAVEDGLLGRQSLVSRALGWVPVTVSGVLGSLFAFFVGSYTGVLLAFTNVPLWAQNRLLQGPLFLASALSTGLAAIKVALPLVGGTTARGEAWLRRAEDAVNVGELGLAAGSLLALRSQARPLVAGKEGSLYWPGAIGLGLALPFLLRRQEARARGPAGTALRVGTGLCTLAGGFLFRWTETRAGSKSSADSRYYFAFSDRQE